MNTHTTAQDIISNAQAVRARLMGQGRMVNRIGEIRAAKEAERKAEEKRRRAEMGARYEIERHERLRETMLSTIDTMWKVGDLVADIAAAIEREEHQVRYILSKHRDRFPIRSRRKKAMDTKPHVTIADLLEKHDRPVTAIVNEILDLYPGVTMREVRGLSRNADLMRVKQHIVYAIRSERPDVSFAVIGRILRRDESVAHHHYNQMMEKMEQRT